MGEKRLVAIKRMQRIFMDLVDCKRILREISILSKLRHDHIVKIYDIPMPGKLGNFDELYVVMEICDSDLKKLIRTGITLSPVQIDTLLYNTLVGLKYIHSANIYHRDLKPANILVNQDCSVKICDFGLARAVGEELTRASFGSPRDGEERDGRDRRQKRHLTGHVVSRWYRAPELILLQETYTSAIDVWSMGCIYAELLGMLGTNVRDRGPLFPGASCFPLSPDSRHSTEYIFHTSGKKELLNMIFNLLGTPTDAEIDRLIREDAKKYVQFFKKREGEGIAKRFPQAEPQMADVLGRMLRLSATERITVDESLAHPVFTEIRDTTKETTASKRITLDFEKEAKLDEPQLC